MTTDFILNGAATGTIAQKLLATNGDVGVLRPYVGNDGRSYVSVADGIDDNGEAKRREIVINAGATLRKDEWLKLDDSVVKIARARMRLVNDFRASELIYTFPNAFGHTQLMYERQSDFSPARISMDGLYPGDNDRPVYDYQTLPLPIISKEVQMNSRDIAVSRNGNTPLDLTNLELATIKVAEEAEKLIAGTAAQYKFGGGTVYGLTNYPYRHTGTFLNPNASGWTPEMLYYDILRMIQTAQDDLHYGPYRLYYSPAMMQYIMRPFTLNYASGTLHSTVASIPGITSFDQLNSLTGNQMLLVQQDAQTARLVWGMDITTTQWEERGGLIEKFRVMAMIVPQFRTDMNNRCGIVHYSGAATTSA